MTPYPVINVKATGENILHRRIEKGYTVLDVQRYLNLACPPVRVPLAGGTDAAEHR